MTPPVTVKGATACNGGCRFAVWAPHADAVYVTGSFNDWSKDAHPLAKAPDGVWSVDVPLAKPGDEYRFRLMGQGRESFRIDPYARRVTSSVGNGVIVQRLSRKGARSFTPAPLNEMVIYELHIGTFGKKTERHGPGNLEGAIERLDHLKELGVNA